MMFAILLYHGVDSGEAWERRLDATDREYVLSRARFEAHIDTLAGARIPVSSLDECLGTPDNTPNRPGPVVITFDDGDASCYTTAAPLLERHGFRGEFFVVSQWVGRPGFLSRDQLRDLIRRGHGVHSHSRTHPMLPRLDTARIDEELSGSKTELEEMIGRPVEYVSIPGGAYDARVVEAAQRAGYRRALISIEGYNEPRDSAFLLRRFTPRSYTDAEFVRSVCLHHRYTRGRLAVKRIALSAAKRVLGETYSRWRAAVISRKR